MKTDLKDIRKIDDLGRVVIPKNFCRVCGITSNDYLDIYFNEKEKVICLKKREYKDYLTEIATRIFEPVYKSFGNTIIITDKEKIIEVFGKKYKYLINQYLSKELVETIKDEHLSISRMNSLQITTKELIEKQHYYFPIKKNGYNIGSIMVLNDKAFSQDLIDYINQLLDENE